MSLSHLASTVFDANFFLRVYTGYFWPLRAVLEALKTPRDARCRWNLWNYSWDTLRRHFEPKKLNWVGRGGHLKAFEEVRLG